MSAEDRPVDACCALGTGIDLVENERVKQTLIRWDRSFKERIFLPRERSYCDSKAEPWRHYAGRFAVKEAVTKAFGTGIGEHIGWQDIEVTRNERTGAPSVELSEKGWKLARERGVRRILISLSHTHHYAVAHALLVGDAI